MSQHRIKRTALSAVAGVAVALCTASAVAQSDRLEDILQVTNDLNQTAQASQVRIDGVSQQTQRLLEQYRAVIKELEGLRAYNAQQERVIRSQEQELANLDQSIVDADKIKRQITPLMLRMIDKLDEFIAVDIPFLLDEREGRVATLRELMDRSDVSESEKFRRVLEAYQIENEYGRTILSWRGSIERDGREITVDYLRVGRVAYVYQSLDGSETAFWNKETGAWQILGDEYRNTVGEGIRIANRQTSPNIVRLPILAPEQAQ